MVDEVKDADPETTVKVKAEGISAIAIEGEEYLANELGEIEIKFKHYAHAIEAFGVRIVEKVKKVGKRKPTPVTDEADDTAAAEDTDTAPTSTDEPPAA